MLEAVLLDVFAELLQLVVRHHRKNVGSGVDVVLLAPLARLTSLGLGAIALRLPTLRIVGGVPDLLDRQIIPIAGLSFSHCSCP